MLLAISTVDEFRNRLRENVGVKCFIHLPVVRSRRTYASQGLLLRISARYILFLSFIWFASGSNFQQYGCLSRLKRFHSTASPVEIFDQERKRQLSLIKRIEKITVKFKDVVGLEDVELKMNKAISTPYTCAKHINKYYVDNTPLTIVNGKQWEFHRPLVEDSDLTLLNFQADDPTLANQAYWRGCSLILGSVLQRALKPECKFLLHRAPEFSVESGSFAYDFSAELGNDVWRPTSSELLALSRMGSKLAFGVKGRKNYYFISPLTISVDLARQMFKDNPYKLQLLDELNSEPDDHQGAVTVHKIGTHVDWLAMCGPVIGHANLLGRFDITAIHKLGEEGERSIYRAQGVSLPSCLTAHPWTYDHLVRNSKPLNTSEEIKVSEDVSVEMPDEQGQAALRVGGQSL